MGLLYLVGTCHVDLKGPERLRKFLRKIKPDKIYLEATDSVVSKVLTKREMREQELKQKKALWKRFLDLFRSPEKNILTVVGDVSCYEVWVPCEYQKENPSVKLHPIQDELFYDLYSFSFAQKFYKQLFNEKFKKLATRESVEIVLDVIVNMLYCNTKVDEPDMFMSVIDELFARKIRTLYNPKECAVFVCGQAHIFNNPDNVYDRLRDLKPSRLKLPDADKL